MNAIVQNLASAVAERAGTPFAVVLPDGTQHRAGGQEPRFTIVIRSAAALLALATRGHIGLLESYFDQQIEVLGDFGAAFATGLASGFDGGFNPLNSLENSLHEWRHANRSPAQAERNASLHYGLGESFYRCWLDDPLLMYTCAYWSDGTTTLEQAQRNKVDHVCRKLQLAAGDRFVDIGCGFGGFLLRAAQTTGAHGTGINTTPAQVRWVRAQIAAHGLDDRLTVQQSDLRQIDGCYDKLASIGVLEHAGRGQLADMLAAHARALRPGGLGLLHFIGHLGRHDTDLFIRKHVFPGGWIPSLADVMVACERCGFEVLDVENLRRHYALTLDAWAERFERRWDEIQALDPQRFTERFRRVWRSYLVGCAELFRSPAGYTHLFQVLVSKGPVTGDGYPMTRAHLYPPDAREASDGAGPRR